MTSPANTNDATETADARETPSGDGISTEEIARGARRGLSWSLLGTLAVRFGSFGMALVLARILTQEDYGAYAVALAATHFVMHINNAGLVDATVQWRGRLEEMAATGATLAFACSIVIYAGFFFLAGPFAALAGNPEAAGVVRVLTLVILVDGLTAVRAGALMRTFRQDKLMKANAAGLVVVVAVTIGLAAAGAGPYSFAWGQVCSSLVTGALVLYWAKLPPRFGFDKAIARRLAAFGVPLAASLGVEAVIMNADYVVVGNVLGATALGFYLMAFNVSSWIPSIVGTAVRYVSLAGYSRLAEKDTAALSAGVERTIPLMLTGLVPLAVIMSTLADPLVEFLLGPQWLPSAGVLRVLMVMTAVKMMADLAHDVLVGAGRTRATLFINLAWAATLVPALWLGTRWGGTVGTALAHVVIGLAVALPLLALALHRVGVRLQALGRKVLRPLLAGGPTLVVCLLLGQLPAPAFVRLAVAGLAGTAVYLAIGLAPEERRLALRLLARLRRRPVEQAA